MYYSHFGLNQPPFKITPNTGFFFSGGNRGPILEAVIYAITHGEGIIKVTGEVGSGKTMLCHMLPTRLPAHIETVYIPNPNVSPEEILHAIAFEMQLPVGRGAQRLEVMQAMHDFLLQRHAAGKRVVVFVEEAQSMSLATLEEVRLLSNLETSNDKLLQIVLFGQPELDDNLRQPNIRQLRERIAHSFRLDPLTQGEIREYLMFRMRTAGYHGPDLFSNPVVKTIARTSLGLTRRVNLIADKALLAAFSENTHTLKSKHIEAAVKDSEFSQQLPRRAEASRIGGGVALVAAGAAAGIAIYVLLQQTAERPADPPRISQPGPVSESTGNSPAAPVPTPPEAAPLAPASIAPSGAGAAAAPASHASHSGSLPAPPAVGGGKTRVQETSDLLEERLAATREWLKNEAPTTITIQVLGTNEPEQLKHLLNGIGKSIDINQIFVYRTVARQAPSITVLYGSFSSTRSAKEALDRLPESLKANRPFMRTVQGIRGEIRRHQPS